MHILLSKPWLELQSEVGNVTGIVSIMLEGEQFFFGEVRMHGQKKWVIYGAFPSHCAEMGLKKLFVMAQVQGVHLVESNFNLSRWAPESMLLAQQVRLTRSFGTYIMDLSQSEEMLLEGMHRKHRKNIRQAQSAGLTIQQVFDADRILNMLNESYDRDSGIGHKYTKAYLLSVFKYIKHNLISLEAWCGETLCAVLLVVYDENFGYSLHAGRHNEDIQGSSHLIQWEMMRLLKSKGVKGYDLGGARPCTDNPRLQGIFRFKSQFGGKFEPCFFWDRITHPGRHKLYQAIIRLQAFRRKFFNIIWSVTSP